jgi:membrane-associated phospholipid phosphatase
MVDDPEAASTAERTLSIADRPSIDVSPQDPATGIAGVIGDLGRLDRAVYGVIADTPTPNLDVPLRELSSLANHSKIWFAIAGGLALFGGETGRRAAVSGVVSIGAASLITNAVVKPLARRRRPDREGEDVPRAREVPMPTSTSFPSGHSASAFAFATAVGNEIPAISGPLRGLAGAVAYSRVHTGVHYPIDVIIGSIVGPSIGGVTLALVRFGKRRQSRG